MILLIKIIISLLPLLLLILVFFFLFINYNKNSEYLVAYRYHKFNDQNENNPKAEKSAIHVAFCKSCLNVDDEVEKEDDDDDHDVKSDSKTT